MGFMFSTPHTGKPKIVIPPSSKHHKTLIWLHGINAYSEEFLDIFEDPSMTPVDGSTKVILLNAGLKTIAVTLGARINSWFNI